jgi:hypothetical protein
MDDLAAAGQAVATSLARAGEKALSFLLGGDQTAARSPPRRRIGSTDAGGDVFSQAAPSPDEKNFRRGSSAGAGRWPPPHLYRPRPGSGGSGGGGFGGGGASAGGNLSAAAAPPSPPSSTTSSARRLPWHLRAREVARAHAPALREVAAMRFAYVDPESRWRPRSGGGGREEGEEDAESDDVAVVVVVAAHFRPRSVTRREALLHSVLVADEVLGGGSDDDDDDADDDDDDDEVEEEEGDDGGGGGGRRGTRSVSESGGGGGSDTEERQQQQQQQQPQPQHPQPQQPQQQQQQSPPQGKRKKKRRRPRDFVVVLFGASATVPALSFDAHFFSELHAALPPGHRGSPGGRMRALYVVHAGWGLRAWLAALRLSEPAVYGRVELVASLRDLERRFGAGGGGGGGGAGAGRVPRPPVHVLAADERRVAAAAAAGQVL